jgi:hypothetical protein
MPPTYPPARAGLDTAVGHTGGLPGCGAASARGWLLLALASGSAQGANLRSSDYQKPLVDSTGHDRRLWNPLEIQFAWQLGSVRIMVLTGKR